MYPKSSLWGTKGTRVACYKLLITVVRAITVVRVVTSIVTDTKHSFKHIHEILIASSVT